MTLSSHISLKMRLCIYDVKHECNAGLCAQAVKISMGKSARKISLLEFLETGLSIRQSRHPELLPGQALSDWRIFCS